MSKLKINFILPADIVGDAKSGVLIGEFNNWDVQNGIKLKKLKDGSLNTQVSLEAGRSYQYRYFLNDGRWVNDRVADDYVRIDEYAIENCLVQVQPELETKKSATKKVSSTKSDDLTKIEGIGKKIAELLKNEGIVSFADLSKSTPKKLKSILDAAGNRYKIHDPGTWPKQAKLAAEGKWDDLKKLQDKLNGGK